MISRLPFLRTAAFAALTAFSTLPALADGEVNVYTTREPGLIQPLLDSFTAETGIKANVVFIKEGLAQRVESEGANSPADLLSVVDYGNLIELVDRKLTQPVASKALEDGIPANLRDPAGNWFGLSMRARVIYASKDRVTDETLTYEDLADPRFKGKICIRSGQHPYNTSLIAAMIAKDGKDATKTWLEGVRANLAHTPGGGDRDVARDILAGICDIGVGNSYYVGLMRSGKGGDEQKAWGEAIRVILPTFKDKAGTHVNISGAAIAKNAPNRDNAVKLLEYLASEKAQEIYAKANFEYPVRPGVAADPIIAALGTLTVDPTPLVEIAKDRSAASELVDATGFDG
ncbi:Fe(3+) ABC transporter substrate-binding protein [Mesorhizobium sp. BR1-1-16]|uniref:Fe(3+) ABC transporter substrate-binding protein n=1 Tax=Mesorhizobium sp. BR1-1-16 TaxID=2876653 RepID=UPI001CCFDF25|nr:Fe(3+) ABC transporter substrate-binding protein [Mesorhizobium sp. BR1-1-16]MBZ9936127.1 Fe(3+) ABC transporter substrate-binding protein [Mesorhizobium sp. BR1-1-16]